MKLIKESTFNEYVRWYLDREYRKCNRAKDNPIRFTYEDEMIEYMEKNHVGKLRPWFKNGKWSIHILDSIDDLNNLVCLEGEWTKKYLIPDHLRIKKNYRILKQMVLNAKNLNYFIKTDEEIDILGDKSSSRYKYYNRFKDLNDRKLPPLITNDRIVLCSLDNDEKNCNPAGNYYLHDGFGRLLVYQYLISYCNYNLDGSVEAFIIEEK